MQRNFFRYLQHKRRVETDTALGEERVEGLGLLDAPGKAVEDEAFRDVVGQKSLLYNANRDLVGNQPAGLYEFLSLSPQCGSPADRPAEDVSGGDRGDVLLLREPGCLGALAGPLGAEDDQAHYFKNPS